MIHNTPEGNQLLFKLMPIEILVHLLALGVFIVFYGNSIAKSDYYPFIYAIGGTNSLRFFLLLYVKHSEVRHSDLENKHGISLLYFGNFLTGTAWSVGLIWLSQVSNLIQLADPLFAFLISSIIMASLAGSMLQSWLFFSFALPCVVLPLSWTLYQYSFQQSTVWAFLSLAAFLLFWVCTRLEIIFTRYRSISRQNTTLLQDLATAKEQAVSHRQTLEKAHESLKIEIKEREAAEEKIRASERETTRILQDMQDTFFRVNGKGEICRTSPSIQFLVGQSAKKILGNKFSDLFKSQIEYQNFLSEFDSKCGVIQNYEVQLVHVLGQDIWASINAHYSSNSLNRMKGFEGTIRDITITKNAAEALHKEKERLHVTLESIGDGVITTDIDRNVEFLNPVAEWMTGWNASLAQGNTLTSVFQLVDENTNKPIALPLKLWLKDGRRSELSNPVVLLNKKKERAYTIELTGAPIFDSTGKVIGTVLVFRNVTKLRTLAKQLSYQASHDALTGLINRTEFESRATQAIQSAQKEHKNHALCYVDLDQFKIVNDTCGHHAGDELLKQLTTQLKESLRESDTLARLGGDEFGVLLVGCPIDRAMEVAEKIRADVEKFRFVWEGRVFRVGASIGLVPISNNTAGLTELLSAADSACYVAKEGGRNQVHLYKPDDRAISDRHGQMQWTQRIQTALEDGRFELHFQTIMPVSQSGSGLSGELLIRMVEDQNGLNNKLIMPNAFIPAAERYQLMPKIDQWVIVNALDTLKNQNNGVKQWDMCCINISGQSIGDSKLLDVILNTLEKSKVSPNILCFEITESSVIANLEQANQFIHTLKEMGCRFALDDFGTGLSSFAYLKNLPVDYLKLDGELVKDIAEDEASYAMVEAINRVAHVMGMKTIAEHVESQETLRALERINVDFAQGFGIEPPVSFTWANAPINKAS